VKLRFMALAASLVVAPAAFTGSLAQSSGGGSDVPKATTKAAVAGATADGTIGTKTGASTSPTSGTAGGGMSTASGMKSGGEAKKSKIPASAP
jgi:hypothetical protein